MPVELEPLVVPEPELLDVPVLDDELLELELLDEVPVELDELLLVDELLELLELDELVLEVLEADDAVVLVEVVVPVLLEELAEPPLLHAARPRHANAMPARLIERISTPSARLRARWEG